MREVYLHCSGRKPEVEIVGNGFAWFAWLTCRNDVCLDAGNGAVGWNAVPYINTKGHTAKIMKSRCQLDLRHFFFSQRVVDRWNGLQQRTIELIMPLWMLLRMVLTECESMKMGYFMDSNWFANFAWTSGLITVVSCPVLSVFLGQLLFFHFYRHDDE